MVNVTALQELMREKEVSVEQAAEFMNIDTATLYRRFKRQGAKFTVGEVEKLAELLEMNAAKMQSIFFENKLA